MTKHGMHIPGEGDEAPDDDNAALPKLDLRGEKPDIDYPCEWTYQLIGLSRADVRRAVEGILGEVEHTLETSRTSSRGKYCSMRLLVTVDSDYTRVQLFKRLRNHDHITMVL
jgi:putative lipoic acid-binding regulatory protein